MKMIKTFDDFKLNNLTEEELTRDISDLSLTEIGKVSSTMMVGKLLTQVRNVKDKELGQVLRTLGILIYITSLQHKSDKEELNKLGNTIKRKRTKTW
jgi:hypothetical protein